MSIQTNGITGSSSAVVSRTSSPAPESSDELLKEFVKLRFDQLITPSLPPSETPFPSNNRSSSVFDFGSPDQLRSLTSVNESFTSPFDERSASASLLGLYSPTYSGRGQSQPPIGESSSSSISSPSVSVLSPSNIESDCQILVVEDNKICNKILTAKLNKMLSKANPKITSVYNGADAVVACSKTVFSLIFMDHDLGSGINGEETTKQIRALAQKAILSDRSLTSNFNTPVISMSDHNTEPGFNEKMTAEITLEDEAKTKAPGMEPLAIDKSYKQEHLKNIVWTYLNISGAN
jgi:CheY-like chemotaxis protein